MASKNDTNITTNKEQRKKYNTGQNILRKQLHK